MEFLILGPLEVRDGTGAVELGAAKQRALLAVLALHANELVSTSRLVEAVWGEHPPATAEKLVHGYVHALRKRLGADVIVTHGPGYKLDVGANGLDLQEFERLTAEAREAPLQQAVELRRRALSLWRGLPLADVVLDGSAGVALARLEALRLNTQLEAVEGELELGRHAALVGELESLAAAHPYQERVHALLMLSLYRAGRQADALAAYQALRRRLADELGLQPSQELRDLEAAILRQDEGLALRERTTASSPRHRRRSRLPPTPPRYPRAALEGPGRSSWRQPPSSCSSAQPSRPRSSATSRRGRGRTELGRRDRSRAEPRRGHVPVGTGRARSPRRRRLGLGRQRRRPDAGADRAQSGTRREVRLASRDADGARGRLRRRLGRARPPRPALQGRSDLRTRDRDDRRDEDRVRDLDGQRRGRLRCGLGRVRRFDARTRRPADGRPHGRDLRRRPPVGIAVGAGSVWVANGGESTVERFNPGTFEEGPIEPPITVGDRPTAIAYGEGAVWVANGGDDTVIRIDPNGNSVRSIPVGNEPAAVAVGAGAVWVANAGDGTVSRIDPVTYKVETIDVGGAPAGIAVVAGRVWVTVREP